MAETLRIEIPIETIDETEPELSNMIKKLGKLGDEADRAGQKAKKSSDYVSEFDRRAQKTEKTLASWAKEKYEVLLEAKDRITPILSTIGGGLKSFAGKTWSITMRAVDLVTSPVRGILNLLRNPVLQAGAVLGVSIGLKDTIDTYKDFEAAMSQVKAISGATGSEVNKLTDKAKEMGATTKFTATESAEAFNYMAMAGWKTGDMLEGIEGILSLAAASGEGLATTSDIVTDSLTAFNMKASEAGHFSDVLAAAASSANTTVSGMGETFKYAGTMAGALGYSIEDVALMTGLMANSSIKASMAGTSLNAIFTRLSTNTNGAADAIQELGIDFYDSERNARDLSDVMGELRKATAGMNAEQKSQLANTVAGMEAQKGLLAILNASEEDYNKLADAINNADGAAAAMAETMMDNLQGSITLLQSAVDGAKRSFGKRLSPYVRELADWLTAQMPAIEEGLNEFMDWVDTRIDRIRRKFSEISATDEWQDADFLGKVKIAWDEFIAEPFLEWWNSTGKAKFAEFAQDIGSGIGTGLKIGVMTLLGIDLGETLDEGVSIGASFAKGFSEGFDFEAVSEKLFQGFGNLMSSAGKLLPGGKPADLSSLMSTAMLMKMGSPLLSMGKGAISIGKGLFGRDAATGTSLMGSLIGTTGDVLAEGSGLLGGFAKVGTGLSGGALSGSTAALAGAGAAAGGIAAGATLISGAMDAYTAIKSDNAEEQQAYGASAGLKVGGVAAGAAIGTLILPGIGTAIGAGIGGIAGWIAGNKVKESYEAELEEAEKAAEKARKAYAATGLAVDDLVFKNQDLAKALEDTEVSAEQFAAMFQEECAKTMKEAFGDIHLSLAEVKKLAEDIVFADMAEGLEEFAQAAGNVDSSLAGVQASMSKLKKENWKVGLGMELSETDVDSYRGAVDNFVASAKQYIEDSHYEATVAMKLLTNGKAVGLDSMYGGFQSSVDAIAAEMGGFLTEALADGILDTDEMAVVEAYQEKISNITNKLAEAENEAKLQAIGIKYSGAELDSESFQAMQEELKAYSEQAQLQYDEALTVTLTNLNLELKEGAITMDEYSMAVEEATEGYYAQIESGEIRIREFNLESIAAAYEESLDGILPELQGSTVEKLSQALDNAVLANPDVESWTQEDVKKWFGLDGRNAETFQNVYQTLKEAALAIPQDTKEEILQGFKDQVPTAQEIMDAIDWDSMTYGDLEKLSDLVLGPVKEGLGSGSPEDSAKLIAEECGEYFENFKKSFSEQLHEELENSKDTEALATFMEQYMSEAVSGFDPSSFLEQCGPVSNGYYEQMVSEWQEAGNLCGDAMNNGASTSLLSGAPHLRSDMQTALDSAASGSFSVSPTVDVSPNYRLVGGDGGLGAQIGAALSSAKSSASSGTKKAKKHAAGGYVSGGPQLSWLAEEGYGEFVIPTNPSRRTRALDLYQQAGAALGVTAHAAGGYVGGANLAGYGAGSYLLNNIDGDAPAAGMVPIDSSSGEAGVQKSGAAPVEVHVSVAPEFVIQGSGGQSEEDIMQVIRKHMKEMADELGGEIAGKLEEVFSNMPIKEA